MAKLFLVFLAAALLFASCTAREEVSVIEPESPAEEERTLPPPRVREPERKPRVREPAPRADRRRVSSDSLNVRSGPNVNYEVLGTLSKGDAVTVKSTQFEWLEIELPRDYRGWVHSDYIELASEFSPGRRIPGRVDASRLNVRALPGTRYSVMAQVSRGDRVVVIDRDGEWLGIEISGLASGWVHSQHVE
jgi:uncharacterized protein YgiM (DUF1202 family)